jgi:hypothetical protein
MSVRIDTSLHTAQAACRLRRFLQDTSSENPVISATKLVFFFMTYYNMLVYG